MKEILNHSIFVIVFTLICVYYEYNTVNIIIEIRGNVHWQTEASMSIFSR